jgi:hypothetical protein
MMVATFRLPGFRHVLRSDALRVVLCVAVAALPQAAELLGSLTNISWFLALWLVLLTLMRLPTSARSWGALAAASVLATFSAPLSVVAAPLWFARAVHGLARRRLRDAAFALLLVCSVVVLVLVAGDLRDAGTPQLARPVFGNMTVLVLANAAWDRTPRRIS